MPIPQGWNTILRFNCFSQKNQDGRKKNRDYKRLARAKKLVKDIQVIIGFANFYQRFIKNFEKIAASLTLMLQKTNKFADNES